MMGGWERRRRRRLSDVPRAQLLRCKFVRWVVVIIILLCIIPGSVCKPQVEKDKVQGIGGGNAKGGEVKSVGFLPASQSTFWQAFWNSVGVILATEIGDKTFFLAALMAMQNPRIIVFLGATVALAIMTVLSSAMGLVLPSILPRSWTQLAGSFLFLYFGVKMIKEGLKAGTGPSDELLEVEHELLSTHRKVKTEDNNDDNRSYGSDTDIETGMISKTNISPPRKQKCTQKLPSLFQNESFLIFSTAFSMTLLAEWGDRSQIATIALAASRDVLGVTVGGIVGHIACTSMAVLGGRIFASSISERNVHLGGGVLFLLFALQSGIAGLRSL